ncbi:hypothetical protein P43SY_007054 [Pythium insidiosum]|uniref:PIPK domain-containing protein n=1 Tax=Pythium insidiosum TaxID=114742 RepID=A0AAD5M6F6_PYTIN|nr:hypothetical protein P43SY_007054 [Pythium insidiosum]
MAQDLRMFRHQPGGLPVPRNRNGECSSSLDDADCVDDESLDETLPRSRDPHRRRNTPPAPAPAGGVSPRPYHELATPSPSHFQLFSRLHTPFPPRDDQLLEVDETSCAAMTNGRRHSSLIGSPTAIAGYKRRGSSLQHIVTASGALTAHQAGDKWRQSASSWRLHERWRPRRRYLRRAGFWCGAVGVFVFCFLLVFALPPSLQTLAPVVLGSLLSFVSSITILVSFLLQSQARRYPNELLVYVAACEFGLAVRALVHVMTYCSESSAQCDAMTFRACSTSTALEMFLLVASVGWFGCAILHLFVSVSNPFANYKSQLKRYHVAVWGGSIALSVVVPLVVFSPSSQTRLALSGAEICRAVGLNFPTLPPSESASERDERVAQWQTLNMQYWGATVALVVLLVVAAQLILAVGWWRSNSGTVIALKARRRMMKRMTAYVHTLNATWLLLLVVFLTYRSNADALEHLATVVSGGQPGEGRVNLLYAAFHFLLAAKGYFTCVVWLIVNKHCCALVVCQGRAQDRWLRRRQPHATDRSESSDIDESSSSDSDSDKPGQRPSPSPSRRRTHGDSRPSSASSRADVVALPSSSSSTSSSSASAASASTWASQNHETLRREIIYYTVCGITKSLLRSAQNPNPTLGAQQLLVGADSSSAVPSSRASTLDALARCSMEDALLSPPRMYCQPLYRPGTTTVSSSLGPSASFLACSAASSARQDAEDAVQGARSESTGSLQGSTLSAATTATLHHGLSFSLPSSSSFSAARAPPLYPVSHVPFELFEQEIELQSQRLSATAGSPPAPVSSSPPPSPTLSSSLHLSPLLAKVRRTATALYSSQGASQEEPADGATDDDAVDEGAEPDQPRGSTGATDALAASLPLRPPAPPPAASAQCSQRTMTRRPKLFVDFAPTEFRAIRKAFGLSDELYLSSFRTTAKERVSAGSSGAFMFFSGDNALIVKSMKEKECRKLVAMAPAYADYITSHPASRIIRFFGCHRLRLYGRNFYFVVMSNVLHSPAHTPTIVEKYDVKGSWIDRQAKRPQPGDLVTCSECNATYELGRGDASTTAPFHVHRPDTILKDLDLTRPLYLSRRVARALFDQLVADAEFLNAMGIMDYSLLIGVHTCEHAEQLPWQREFLTSMSFLATGGDLRDQDEDEQDRGDGKDRWGRMASCGAHLEPLPEQGDFPEELYFVGIIDILQEWNWEKQLEKMGKMLIGKTAQGISAMAPDAYCQRFKARLAQVLRLEEDLAARPLERCSLRLPTAAATTASPEDASTRRTRWVKMSGRLDDAAIVVDIPPDAGDLAGKQDSDSDMELQFDDEVRAAVRDLELGSDAPA